MHVRPFLRLVAFRGKRASSHIVVYVLGKSNQRMASHDLVALCCAFTLFLYMPTKAGRVLLQLADAAVILTTSPAGALHIQTCRHSSTQSSPPRTGVPAPSVSSAGPNLSSPPDRNEAKGVQAMTTLRNQLQWAKEASTPSFCEHRYLGPPLRQQTRHPWIPCRPKPVRGQGELGPSIV